MRSSSCVLRESCQDKANCPSLQLADIRLVFAAEIRKGTGDSPLGHVSLDSLTLRAFPETLQCKSNQRGFGSVAVIKIAACGKPEHTVGVRNTS